MLKSAHDDPWCDIQFLGEGADAPSRKWLAGQKLLEGASRNKKIGRKVVGLFLFLQDACVFRRLRRLNKDILLSVLQNMSSLMEEGEPKEIVRLSSQAQLQDCLLRREPTCCTVGPSSRKLRNKNDCDSARGAKLLHCWLELLRLFSC